ncbi:MAG: C25 family cysteine peptidase [Candidatus Thermoplasmatota archaeon]
MSTIFTLVATFILLGSFLSVAPSQSSREVIEAYRGELELNSEEPPDMYVLVNSSIHASLQEQLGKYKEDVETMRNLDVKIFENNHSSADEIRSFLRDGYEHDDLVGTFFVGNLPYAEFEVSDDYGEGKYARFPIDLYYTDLDGTWRDTNNSGVYDEHAPGDGDLDPEIWLGRISMKTEWEDEVGLYKNYFEKLYQYRRGNLSLPDDSLLYVDDDWVPWTPQYKSALAELYNNITAINDVDITSADDYSERVKEGYEWIQIHCHANHSAKRHAFRDNGGPKGSGGNFTSRDLYEEGQKSLFTNVFTCGAADYTVSDYLCGWYALTDEYGLANVGSTKSGSMLEFQNYYQPLSSGMTMGEAMKQWWIDTVGSDQSSISWFYGMTTIGDPTLSPLDPDIDVYELDVDSQGGGEVEVDPDQDTYLNGTEVDLKAIPVEGYYFEGWSGTEKTGEEITLVMDENKSITANFEKVEHELSISVSGEGTTDPNPGEHTYENGTDVTVEATPADGWQFVEWTGDETGTDPTINVTMDANKSITAVFEEEMVVEYTLTISVDGGGSTEPSEGTHNYSEGDEVTVEATPDDGWEFDEWTGDVNGAHPVINVTMDANKSITAVFEEEMVVEYTLTIDIDGEGSTDPPEGTHNYSEGDEETVEATPSEGWQFIEWVGDATGTGPTINVTMDADREITAVFEEVVEHDLTINIEGNGTTDPSAGNHTYEEGTKVTVEAMPAEGWEFVEWTGGMTESDPVINVTMDADKSVTAVFEEEVIEYDLSINIEGQGSTEPSEGTLAYEEGSVVSVEALPAEGWSFVEWTGGETGTEAAIEVTMDEDKEITAHFEKLAADIIVTNFTVDEDGLEITITADIENVGDAEGTIDLIVEGEVVDSFTIGPGDVDTIEKTHRFEEEGEYRIELGDESENVNVEEDGEDSSLLSDYWWLIPIIVLVAGIVIAMIWGDKKPPDKKPSEQLQHPQQMEDTPLHTEQPDNKN